MTLTVTDDDGGVATDTLLVTVSNVAPTADAGADQTADESQLVSFSGTFTDPGPLDVHTIDWDFGDGQTAAGTLTPDHAYADDGVYTVTLTVTDDDGGVATDTLLVTVDNVDPAPAITGLPAGNISPEHTPISLSVDANDPGTLDTFTYLWEVIASNGQAIPDGSDATFGLTPDDDGTYAVTVTVTDDDTGVGTVTEIITVTHVTFRVTDFTANASGFDAKFIREADMSVVNLYDGIDAGVDVADVTVTGPSGPVAGSLVWHSATDTASWVATGGVLAAGNYDVTLASRSDGWKDERDGELLDGNSDGTVGDDFTTTFTVDPLTDPVVSLPDFARGPDQAVDVPATAIGLPISISDGTSVTDVRLVLDYDWSVLNVTGASLAAGVPGDWLLTTVDLTVDGRVVLEASGATGLPAGATAIIDLTASVPVGAQYGAAQILRISSLELNGGAIDGVADQAVHKVAYLGDATGNRGYSGLDASFLARVAAALDTGFDAFELTDPVIIGDTADSGSVSSMDTTYVAGKAVGLSQPQIPDLPASNSATPIPMGIEPTVSIPAEIRGVPGSTSHATADIDDAAGLQAFDFTITYDTALLDLSNADVSLAGLTATDWSLVSNVNDVAGEIRVVVWATEPLGGGAGSLLDMAFQVLAGAETGTTPLDLEVQFNETMLDTTAVDGSVFIFAGEVKDQHIFYNNSVFDINDPDPYANDDNAIAADKEALLPDGEATFENYTSYRRGINGIMVDVANLPPVGGDIDPDDYFEFKVGNSDHPSSWQPAPDPVTVAVREDDGTDGSNRLTIIWADNDIRNEWLQVTVLANTYTGLAAEHVFYFGNAVAEAGNSTSDVQVGIVDLLLARNNPRNFFSLAEIDFPYDYNRDQRVNSTDVVLARNNQTNFLHSLRLVDLSGNKEEAAAGDTESRDGLLAKLAWLEEFEQFRAKDQQSGEGKPAEETMDAWLAIYGA